MRKLLGFVLSAICWGLIPTACADSVQCSWSYSFDGSGFSGNGTMTSNGLNVGPPGVLGLYSNVFVVDSINGTIDGLQASENQSAIYSLIQQWDGSGPNGQIYNPSTGYGLNFVTTDGELWTLFHPDTPHPPGYDFLLWSSSTPNQLFPVTVQITPVPEPPMWVLIVAGLVAWIIISVIVGGFWGRLSKVGEGE